MDEHRSESRTHRNRCAADQRGRIFPSRKFVVDNPSGGGNSGTASRPGPRRCTRRSSPARRPRRSRPSARATQPPRLRASLGGRRVASPRRDFPRPRLALDRDPLLGSAPADPPRTRLRRRARSLPPPRLLPPPAGRGETTAMITPSRYARARADSVAGINETNRSSRFPRRVAPGPVDATRRDATRRDHPRASDVPDGTPPPLPLVVASPLTPFASPPSLQLSSARAVSPFWAYARGGTVLVTACLACSLVFGLESLRMLVKAQETLVEGKSCPARRTCRRTRASRARRSAPPATRCAGAQPSRASAHLRRYMIFVSDTAISMLPAAKRVGFTTAKMIINTLPLWVGLAWQRSFKG